jgi:hypothetical protein
MPTDEQVQDAAAAIRKCLETNRPEINDTLEADQKIVLSEMLARAALCAR